MSDTQNMRALMEAVQQSIDPYAAIKENDGNGYRPFTSADAMNMQEVNEMWHGSDYYVPLFKQHGAGVYMAFVGSRGMLEDMTYVGRGPDFDYTDYSDQYDDQEWDDEDEEDDEDHGHDDGEFTGCAWYGKQFECGRNEEESDVYFYWNGK